MAKIALFGAAGAVGKSIAAALQNDNTPYRVVGRSRNSLQTTFGADPLAEVKTWNPDDPASVRQAAEVGYLAIVRPLRCQLMSALVSSMKTPSQPPAWTSARTFESHFVW